MQRLLTIRKLRDVDPCEYLVDALQRAGHHAASRVDELMLRRWKTLFAANPLQSPLYDQASRFKNAA